MGVTEADDLALETHALAMASDTQTTDRIDPVTPHRNAPASDEKEPLWRGQNRPVGVDAESPFDDLAMDSWALEETLDDIAAEIDELNGPRSAADELFGGVFA